jgi:hypothetical protein
MSASERRAFIGGWELCLQRRKGGIYSTTLMEELDNRYPDKPCGNVREMVVEWLKENGYGGLYCEPGRFLECQCTLEKGIHNECMNAFCLPGVLRDGKIVPKEEA